MFMPNSEEHVYMYDIITVRLRILENRFGGIDKSNRLFRRTIDKFVECTVVGI